MSCELRLLSLANNLEKCRLYLFQGDDNGRTDPSWLQKCVVAASPFGDRIIIAHGAALVSLIAQWDRNENSARFVISKQWELSQETQAALSETITSAIILPIVAAGNQTQGLPDWYCIVVGLSSGSLRFMTENLITLADVRLHSEMVLHIKATRPKGRDEKRTGSDPPEYLTVVYPSVICSVPGFSLFQTLRGCRSEVALKRARDDKTSSKVSVEHKKYSFSETPVRDACVINSRHSNNFDHLLAVTIAEGFYKNYRPSPPQQTIFASTGQAAWLQFDHSTEGVAAPLELTDVALTVISKLPGWLGLSSGKASEPAPKPTEKLYPRCKLLDRRRGGKSVICSPDGSLLVVVDLLGRVTLVEARTGVAIRLWKGYRDAECGFLEVEEEITKTRHKHRHESSKVKPEPRVVLLLVIYVPKKGLIELFPMRHGPRVAAVRVSKSGRLLYVPHGLMGHTTPAPVPRKGAARPSHLVFLSADGLMDLVLPFHCALMDVNARTKDLHLQKQIKLCLKEGRHDEVAAIIKQLETDEIKLSAIDLLSSNNAITPDTLNAAIDVILETAHDTDVPQHSGTTRNVHLFCKQLRRVVRFYCALEDLPGADKNESTGAENKPLKELLQLSDSEIEVLRDFITSSSSGSQQRKENRVTFHVSSKGSLSRFIQSLDLSESGSILATPKLSQEDHRSLGEFIFSKIASNLHQLNTWNDEAKLSNIGASLFARCFITFWLSRPIETLEDDVRQFIKIMKVVCSLSDEPITSPDYNFESTWWMELRAVIAQSRNTLAAMIVSLCCRSVSLICEQQDELEKCENPKDNEPDTGWETISADTWQWDALISRLEDVHLLNTVLKTKNASGMNTREDQCEVSLSELMSSGDSAVSELVAKWLIQFCIEPGLLVDESDAEFQTSEEPTSDPKKRNLLKGDDVLIFPLVEVSPTEPQQRNEILIEKFKLLKRRFPCSLTSSGILSHVGWEIMCLWQQDLTNVPLFDRAIDYFIAIPSAHLKSAICSLAWSAYVKVHFEGITRLVSKMGKLPTDTLCVREIGMSRASIAEVMKSARRLLNAILDACSEHPQVRFILRRDALWGSSQQPSSLISVAVSRPYPCEDVVLLHHQMTTTIHMVAALEIRDKAVLSALFDSLKNELFGELTTKRSIALHHPWLSDILLAFLRRAISAAVQTIREIEAENGEVCVEALECYQWLRVCMELGSTWRLPLDALRRHHVCELYAAGYDRLAEEALPEVNDTSLLASQLLVVVGQSIKTVISTSTAPQEVIAALSPSLTTWLNSLDEDGSRSRRANIADTQLLMSFIIHHLPGHHIDSHIATIMAECITGL